MHNVEVRGGTLFRCFDSIATNRSPLWGDITGQFNLQEVGWAMPTFAIS